jgi:hypothetical protein
MSPNRGAIHHFEDYHNYDEQQDRQYWLDLAKNSFSLQRMEDCESDLSPAN